jgi:FkbM family methyltransferase
MKRRVYIDLGANVGDTMEEFLARAPDALAIGFEPNPRLIDRLRSRFAGRNNVVIHDAAAWSSDGYAMLYLGHDLSSTLLKGKAAKPEHPEFGIDYRTAIRVRTIDFAKWLLENVSDGEDVCVKMDIEGSEYEVLRRLLETGAIARISELRCEWHYDRYPIGIEEHTRTKMLVDRRVKLVEWE